MTLYSATSRGFFTEDQPGIPPDATAVDDSRMVELFNGQAQGAQIVPGENGVPVLEWPAPITPAAALAAWRATKSVTAYQAKAALYNRGLLDDADAVATAAGGLVLLAWQTATHFQRNAASIAALAPAIGITDPEDLDDLFREADAIIV